MVYQANVSKDGYKLPLAAWELATFLFSTATSWWISPAAPTVSFQTFDTFNLKPQTQHIPLQTG